MKNWKSRLAAALALAAVCGVLPAVSRFATITVTASAAPAILPIQFRGISSTATNFTISGAEVDGWYEFVWATNLLSGFTNKLVFQATGSTMTVDFPADGTYGTWFGFVRSASTGSTPPGPGTYMEAIADDMQASAPSHFTQTRGGVDYGRMERVSYYSKDGKMNKYMNVLLPPGYSTREKYPVLYVLHEIFGDESSMPGMGIQTMMGNLLADGLAGKMIIVFPNMYTGSGSPGYAPESMHKYDLVREDIENSIMPYMEAHYSMATGKEITAITGFALGGREALYAGITRSEVYGYVGAACPAPGIFETTDAYMHHEGCLPPNQFRPSSSPAMILISAGMLDDAVADSPKRYHDALDQNGVEHLWQMLSQGDHGSGTLDPHMYNFLHYVFKG